MKHSKLTLLASLLATLNGVPSVLGQGTAFTYQGQLTDNGAPAQGTYDFRFKLYDAAAGGVQLGADLTVVPVTVSGGLFTVTLDFGAGIFTGPSRWLEIGVRTNGAVTIYTSLSPRQLLAPTPYAIYAAAAANAAVAASLPWSGLTGLPVGFADGVDNDTLYAASTGLTLTGTNFSLNTAFTDARYWKLDGNAATTAGVNFLGTTDNQALELKVNNARALRLEPNDLSPNVVGGFSGNFVEAGIYGAAIGGGGALGAPNAILAPYATIAGGQAHIIQSGSDYGAIGGGYHNNIGTNSDGSAIGGGLLNIIAANSFEATVAGGYNNGMGTNCDYGAIGGGYINIIAANSPYATVAGGRNNDIGASCTSSAIGGGYHNNIAANSTDATIGGGGYNEIGTNSDYSAVGGGYNNNVAADSPYATIGGGGYNGIGTNSDYSTVGGGYNNNIATNSSYATIAGGAVNEIQHDAQGATVSGGQDNSVQANGLYGTISGGYLNTIRAGASYSTVAGGEGNAMGTNASYNAIGGGLHNTNNGDTATISGGELNLIRWNSLGSSIGGGAENTVGTGADYATIPGGRGAKAAAYGQLAYASGSFATNGDAQASMFVLRGTSTTATLADLFLNGSGERITVPPSSSWVFDILVIGRTEPTSEFGEAHSAGYQLHGIVVRYGTGAVSVLGLTTTWHFQDLPLWNVTAESDANFHLRIRATGGDNTYTIRWVANVRTAEVAFP